MAFASSVGGRYVPISAGVCTGITMLRDTTPGEAVETVAINAPTAAAIGEDDSEPPPPEPFEYIPDAED